MTIEISTGDEVLKTVVGRDLTPREATDLCWILLLRFEADEIFITSNITGATVSAKELFGESFKL